jgi:hypothetical protein
MGVLNRQREALRNHELVVTGTQWPHCIYEDEMCDPEDPWKGLLKNILLVKVSGTMPERRQG